MVEVEFTKEFSSIFLKIKEDSMKSKIMKQLKKIKENPEIGKPMQHARKGTREVYVKPFRLSYAYHLRENVLYILDLYHKKRQ
jgi:mRNA-degrading endonuclease RelE of RelBE toxin-antitoxin system